MATVRDAPLQAIRVAALRLSRQVELHDDDVDTLLAVDSAYGMQPPVPILSLHPLLPLRLAAELLSPSICGGVHLTAPFKPSKSFKRHLYENPMHPSGRVNPPHNSLRRVVAKLATS